MIALHGYWAYVVVVMNVLAGLSGLFLAWRKRRAPGALWGLIVAGQAALAVQVTLGVVAMQRVSPPGQHVFYGFMLLFVAVLAWTFRGESPRRGLATMSGVALFVGVVSVRAMTTAAGFP